VLAIVFPVWLVLAGVGPKDTGASALERINAYRAVVNLPPVTLDPALSRSCQEHADYLLKNFDAAFTGQINVHDEDPKLPGYSDAGRKAARASVISQARGAGDPLLGIDVWLASFYHRTPLLDPGLAKVGIGFVREADGSCFVVVDTKSGKIRPKDDWIVCYPTHNQRKVPCVFCLGFPELPNPLPDNGASDKAGHPITISFFMENPALTAARAVLKDDDGKEVPIWLSSPEKPAVKNYGKNTICLIPQVPLRPQTTYTVTLSVRYKGKPWTDTWKFTTGDR
jgi:Cysteine-rich secretory protein family